MDKKIEQIIAETAKELGVPESRVTKVVENTFNYLRNSMGRIENKEYYIPKFGKFRIIQKRYDKMVEKSIKTEQQTTNINNTTN